MSLPSLQPFNKNNDNEASTVQAPKIRSTSEIEVTFFNRENKDSSLRCEFHGYFSVLLLAFFNSDNCSNKSDSFSC